MINYPGREGSSQKAWSSCRWKQQEQCCGCLWPRGRREPQHRAVRTSWACHRGKLESQSKTQVVGAVRNHEPLCAVRPKPWKGRTSPICTISVHLWELHHFCSSLRRSCFFVGFFFNLEICRSHTTTLFASALKQLTPGTLEHNVISGEHTSVPWVWNEYLGMSGEGWNTKAMYWHEHFLLPKDLFEGDDKQFKPPFLLEPQVLIILIPERRSSQGLLQAHPHRRKTLQQRQEKELQTQSGENTEKESHLFHLLQMTEVKCRFENSWSHFCISTEAALTRPCTERSRGAAPHVPCSQCLSFSWFLCTHCYHTTERMC